RFRRVSSVCLCHRIGNVTRDEGMIGPIISEEAEDRAQAEVSLCIDLNPLEHFRRHLHDVTPESSCLRDGVMIVVIDDGRDAPAGSNGLWRTEVDVERATSTFRLGSMLLEWIANLLGGIISRVIAIQSLYMIDWKRFFSRTFARSSEVDLVRTQIFCASL